MDKGTKVYLIISDPHIPSHDQLCWDAVCEFAEDMKFDGLVLNGDLVDLGEIDRHSEGSLIKRENKRVRHTMDVCNTQLDKLQKALGAQCKDNYLIEGNHDDRIKRLLQKGDNAVLKDYLPELEEALKLKKRGIKYIESYPKAKIQLGKLWITHGIWTNEFHAKKHVDQFKACVYIGHAHRQQMYIGASIDGQIAGWASGHMADETSDAMSYAPTPNSWSKGFGIVYVRSNGEFNVQQIQFWNHTFFYGNRQYGKKEK